MFYTYTTLAKATKAGARYLSYSKDYTDGDTTISGNAITRAQSLVVCGYEDCTGKTPIVSGLSTANVKVSPAPFIQIEGTIQVQYLTVEIQNYTYSRGVFTLDGVTGASGATSVYKALAPKTTMRYLL